MNTTNKRFDKLLHSKHYHLFLLLIIVLLGSFLRIAYLSSVPPGFNQDEASIGYNAYSILQNGKDEYGKSFPLYFKAFGDQKLPVYMYATSISELIFVVNEFAVRFPSAIFGIACIPLLYLLIVELTYKRHLALIASLLIAINPWSLHYNRSAFEVSISLFLFLAGTLSLNYWYSKKRKGGLVVGTIFFILSLYSYNLTRLLSPLLYVFIHYWFYKRYGLPGRRESVAAIIVSIVLLSPFIFSILTSAGIQSASGTLIFSSARFKAPLIEFRAHVVDISPLYSKLFFNTPFMVAWEYLKHVTSYLSVDFLFLNGENHGNHGIGNIGQFYLVELPFVLLGLWKSIKIKDNAGYFFLIWGGITIAVASLTREAPQATRSFFLLVPILYFSAVGIVFAWQIIFSKKLLLKLTLSIVIGLCIIYNLLYYFTSYYVRFPVQYADEWRSEDKEVALYLASINSDVTHIIFDQDAGFDYASLLFFTKYNPESFYTTVHRLPDDSEGFSKVVSFGKYEFRKIDWDTDLHREKTIIISSDKFKPANAQVVKRFEYPVRPVVIADGQNIYQFPVVDNAYVAIKTY